MGPGVRDRRDRARLHAAGAGVYQTFAETEQVRAQLVADGQYLWDASPAART